MRRDYSAHAFAVVLWCFVVFTVIASFTWGPWEFVGFALPVGLVAYTMTVDLFRGDVW